MRKNLKSILGVALVLLCCGCDLLHAPIYNLTACPVEVMFSISKFPHSLGAPVEILSGHNAGVLGGNEAIKYDEIVVRDIRHIEQRYDENALIALRPVGVVEDRWSYSENGLSFLNEEPSPTRLRKIAEQYCGSTLYRP